MIEHLSDEALVNAIRNAFATAASSALGSQLAQRNAALGAAKTEIAGLKSEIKSLLDQQESAGSRIRELEARTIETWQTNNARETQLEDALRAAGIEVPSVLDAEQISS